jgi:hypothetical protein
LPVKKPAHILLRGAELRARRTALQGHLERTPFYRSSSITRR